MSRDFLRFKSDLRSKSSQNASNDHQEHKFLVRKFKYFDRVGDHSVNYTEFSKVMSRLGLFFPSKQTEYEIFTLILQQQVDEGFLSKHSKTINYLEFVNHLMEWKSQTAKSLRLPPGSGSNRNNKTSRGMVSFREDEVMDKVGGSEFEKAVIQVSHALCNINLLYVLQHLNAEIRDNLGHRQIKYHELLTCFMKIGFGFKFEVGLCSRNIHCMNLVAGLSILLKVTLI